MNGLFRVMGAFTCWLGIFMMCAFIGDSFFGIENMWFRIPLSAAMAGGAVYATIRAWSDPNW